MCGVCVSRELYKDALENVSAFNSRLRFERRLRIPFIDAQTGIAMNNCNLWISKLERRPGQTPHYIYSYPAKRWRKKKRPPPTERTADSKASETEGRKCSRLGVSQVVSSLVLQLRLNNNTGFPLVVLNVLSLFCAPCCFLGPWHPHVN